MSVGILRSYGSTDFITGLRAIAATMVIVIHTGALGGLGWVGENITASGKYGVQVFFVISGYTIAATWVAGDGYGGFLIRRLARIAPTYWFMIALASVLYLAGISPGSSWLAEYGASVDAYNILMHFSFLSFLDYRVANSIIGVEWSIPIEVFWYVLLPFLVPAASRWRCFLIWLVVLAVAAVVTRAVLGIMGPSTAAKWFPTTFGPYFLIGAACYHLRSRGWHRVSGWGPRVMWGSVALFVLVLVTAPSGGGALIGLATAGLLVARRDSDGSGWWLDSTVLRFLGTISYSLYLWHMLVIMVLGAYVPVQGSAGFCVVFGVTVAASWLTYLFIERPTNAWGKTLSGIFAKDGRTARLPDETVGR